MKWFLWSCVGEAVWFRVPPWALWSGKHSWKFFFTLNSFPTPIRGKKSLQATYKTLQCSHQVQSNFWSLKPLLHVQILMSNWSVDQKDSVSKIWLDLQMSIIPDFELLSSGVVSFNLFKALFLTHDPKRNILASIRTEIALTVLVTFSALSADGGIEMESRGWIRK